MDHFLFIRWGLGAYLWPRSLIMRLTASFFNTTRRITYLMVSDTDKTKKDTVKVFSAALYLQNILYNSRILKE